MDSITSYTFALYSTMAIFLFYQKLHLRNFRGSSQSFEFLLGISALLGTITGIAFIIYFGVETSWVGASVLFLGGMAVAGILGPFIERLLGGLALSLAAFVGWPICAFFLFKA